MGGQERLFGGDDSFLTCDGEFHTVVYDSERAEPVCSKCGLVLDEMKLDFLIESGALPRRAALSRTSRKSNRSAKPISLERSLLETFSNKSVQRAVRERALELCNVVRKQRFQRGYSVSTLTSTLVYAAHRMCRVPITLAECTAASKTEGKRVAQCYDNLSRQMKLNVPRFESTDYLYHLARKKKVDFETVALANKILERVKKKRLEGGSNPIGIAAAALHIAGSLTKNRITQKELAKAASVSGGTVRVNCNKLCRVLPLDERRV